MKLRNKKTGEIWDIGKILTNDYPSYDNLSDINENFEDIQTEPLIKDEKVRKAVRAWAEANNIKEVVYIIEGNGHSVFNNNGIEIDFTFQVSGVPDDKHYTITELCGEEE